MACIILDPPKNGEILRNSELGRSGLRKKMRRSFLGGKGGRSIAGEPIALHKYVEVEESKTHHQQLQAQVETHLLAPKNIVNIVL